MVNLAVKIFLAFIKPESSLTVLTKSTTESNIELAQSRITGFLEFVHRPAF
jgi:hypothetical protein